MKQITKTKRKGKTEKGKNKRQLNNFKHIKRVKKRI